MLASPAETIQEPRDFGQRIAADYWRRTPHVWSSQGKGKPCGLCLLPDTGQHREPEPYPAQPTFVRIYDHSGYLSCGHGPVGVGGRRPTPIVGQTYDCWDCQRPVDDRNRPGLPDEIRKQIEAQLPKCPKCGGPIDKIPFIKRTVHKFQADVDFQSGEILAGSEDHDTLEEEPDWVLGSLHFTKDGRAGALVVECPNKHSWEESRLVYSHEPGEVIWRVLEAESKS